MKHPIIIDGKKYKIKAIKDLTTAEFIELSKIENPDVLKYIAFQTGVTIDKAFFAIISPQVEKAIGKIPDITKMPVPKWVDKSKIIETVGQRHQIESSNVTGLELLVLCLAVSQARSNNFDEVQKLQDEYMKQPFAQVLPAGFFFFKTFRNGKKRGLKSFVLQLASTSIKNLKKALGLTG